MFVFRNNTIERFFPANYLFSGYDDISSIPEDNDGYIWFYQAPIRYDLGLLADEIHVCLQKFHYVIDKISPDNTIIAFTMDLIYATPFVNNDFRAKKSIDQYNSELFDAAETHANLKIIDLYEFTRQYPIDELIDWKYYFLTQMGFNPRIANEFKVWFSQKLNQIALKRKKCLVLDLDNTLWGGILGEDGPDGINLGNDYPGKAFLNFQKGLAELRKSGVILAICSKNNEQDVLNLWQNNPYIPLKKDYFAAYRINWQDKATNLIELAEELNLGLDSFVFVDDSPTERKWIKKMLPMVSVPDFPDQPYNLPLFFKTLVENYFKVYTVTNEDRTKTEFYISNALRTQSQKQFSDFESFLKSLNIKITIEPAKDFNIQRIAQMTQKTNQFNLTTKRYTDSDIKTMLAKRWKIFCISVTDKFGDSGITGCIIVNGNEIDTFLLSCRILGKGIETAFLKKVLSLLKTDGLKILKAQYIPTAKNTQVKNFLDKNGFTCIAEKESGEKEYTVNLEKIDLNIKDYYKINIV